MSWRRRRLRLVARAAIDEPFDVGAIEQLAARRLRRRGREIRMREQLVDDRGDRRAARGELAIEIVGSRRYELVVPRRSRRRRDRCRRRARHPIAAARRHDVTLRDAADVLERAPDRRREKSSVSAIGDERRALAARGDVAHAEIAHDVEPRALRDHRGFADLPRRVRRRRATGVTVRPIARTSCRAPALRSAPHAPRRRASRRGRSRGA